ncbi:serine/threonine-protein kinase [Streptomyces sp. NPDC059104]|uniref:serine/threonine-protein kinase n=1 Tax=Streptomyces sp. NPDC059104 TaxID=3346729 RepID=UPI0036C97F40
MYQLNEETDPAVLGPFELLAVLGQGGMGRTYLGRLLPLQRMGPELETYYHLAEPDDDASAGPVLAAVKVVIPSLLDSEDAAVNRARFAQEIDAMGTVVDPRVPALLGAEPEAAKPWLAMEYVHGPTLHKMITAKGTFGAGPYAALGLALVDALRAIHGVKMLHRDLKPGNIALGPHGPVVLDFGLAVLQERSSEAALTRTGKPMGTISYMPMEQALDAKHVNEPADIYALGAVLFFAAAGKAPYPHGPVYAEPSYIGVPAAYLPLLAQILVQVESQRPSLDAIEQSLIQLLAQHGLTVEAASEELRLAVADSGLVPELPESAYADQAPLQVRQEAQQAVDQWAAPDEPHAEEPDLFDEFFAVEEPPPHADEEEAPEPGPAIGPAEYVPTLIDSKALPFQSPKDTTTSYRLAPPQPAPAPAPPVSVPSPAALRVAERLRKAYARSGSL